jgi:hypothetical protein
VKRRQIWPAACYMKCNYGLSGVARLLSMIVVRLAVMKRLWSGLLGFVDYCDFLIASLVATDNIRAGKALL